METLKARNVVIGSGAMGAATAYHLAKRGEPVVLLEQFAIGHDRGSSHGAARITRYSYADSDYARLMRDAFQAWKGLEADAGQNLYLRTGGVSLSPPEVGYVAQVAASLESIGVPHRRMTGRELRRSFPQFEVHDDLDVVFEPDAGILAASRCVALQVELARQLGVERTVVMEQCPVRRIDLEGSHPTVITDAHEIVAHRLIVTAGAWTQRLVPEFPLALRPTRQQVLYFQPSEPSAFLPGNFPIFIEKGPGELDAFYGMPDYLGQGVKVARHGGGDVDPDHVERIVDAEYHHLVREFLRRTVPSLAVAPVCRTEVCLYTVAPDEHFRLGPLPECPDVIVASPCSGHGFKFSCLIGQVLADLAVTGETAVAIPAWRL
jgi:sarcosine oxidase